MRKVLLLAAMLAMVLLVASPAFAQSRGPSGADGSYNCEDFDFQEDAQAFYNQDPSDPDGLDGPPGEAFTGEQGVACEGLPSRGSTETPPTDNMADEPSDPSENMADEPADPSETQYTTSDEQYTLSGELLESSGDLPASTQTYTELPDTGGPALLLPVGALLVGAGILTYAVIRRR